MEVSKVTGTLFGVGLGPGDPELITVKALRLIKNAEVIAYPEPDDRESFARSIAAKHFPENVIEIPIVVPMRAERFPAQNVYDEAARTISGHLRDGRNVVVLCQGDPFFYGSFMYLHERLSKNFSVRIVPGVTSMTTCAAAAGIPLCARMEPLNVIPAPIGERELENRLSGSQAAVIVKIGRHLPKVRRVLEKSGLAEKSVFVAHASLDNELVRPLSEAPQTAPYFSIVLVPGSDPYAV